MNPPKEGKPGLPYFVIEPIETVDANETTVAVDSSGSNSRASGIDRANTTTITSSTIGSLIFHLNEVGVHVCGISSESRFLIPPCFNYSNGGDINMSMNLSAYIRPIAYAAVLDYLVKM